MNEILDDHIVEKKAGSTFSKLAFAIAILNIMALGYLFSPISTRVIAAEGLPNPPLVFICACWVFILSGLVCAIMSIVKKEKNSLYKWVGGILNILIFLLIVCSVIFARVVHL